MGNAAAAGTAACCSSKDSELDRLATIGSTELYKAEAVPEGDDALFAMPTSAAEQALNKRSSEAGKQYSVSIENTDNVSLGVEIDYLPERNALHIVAVTGGLVERWNKDNPDAQILAGDAITEVNGVRSNAPVMLESLRSFRTLKMTLSCGLNLECLKGELEDLVRTKSCGPILIRLSWHDCGVFAEGRGGCPNAVMRFQDGGEGKFDANVGLIVAIELLRPIADRYCPDLLSIADLWALAANVAIRTMGGPDIPTRFGRMDAKSACESVPSQEGRLPDGAGSAAHLREIFNAKGFDDKDIVALSGAHTVGRCHIDRSGFDGAWTDNPLAFDNTFFRNLLQKTYVNETTSVGCNQHRHAPSQTMMLPSDMALLQDTAFKEHVERYASQCSEWYKDFAAAWARLQEAGLEGLRDTL